MRWKRLEASERARFAVATTAEAAASPACLLPLQSCSLPAKGKTIPPLSLSHSIRRRSEICIWEGRRRRREKVLLLPSLRSLARHRACICPSSIYGDSCHCGGRENEEEESANSIWEVQEMPVLLMSVARDSSQQPPHRGCDNTDWCSPPFSAMEW